MLIRGYEKRICCYLMILIFILSFSMFSFSAAYTGAYLDYEEDPVTGIVSPVLKDVNPTGQTFSGSNVIEMNAFNNAPELEANTFNGSTEINNTFQNLDSTGNKYNGSVDMDLKGNGNMISTADTFQNASVDASMSTVTFDSPTFNGNTTLQANSLTLGSVPQMDTLINIANNILSGIAILLDNIMNPIFATSATRTFTFNNNQYSYNLTRLFGLSGTSYYTNFSGRVNYFLNALVCNLSYGFSSGNLSSSDPSFTTINYNGLPVVITRLPYYQYSYDVVNDVIESSEYSRYQTFITYLGNNFSSLLYKYNLVFTQYMADTWYRWYSPRITPDSNYFWYVYNTDTGNQESINLAGLLYDISWYLGQMYVLQSASESLDNMTDKVEEVSQTFQEAEQKEQEIMSSINSGIVSFNPDLSEIGAFKALGWCSNYLQLVFLRLGTYGTVILVGLLLGVCMQFIGYFRYK